MIYLFKMVNLKGKIIKGIGEGKHYIAIYSKHIHEIIGYVPYLGTLNIKITDGSVEEFFNDIRKLTIYSFQKNGISYGSVVLYLVKLNGFEVYVVRPIKTSHHNDVVEIISDVDLKEKLDIDENSEIIITK